MPKASCGRSWLNSSRHKSKAACSAFRGSNSRAISRCIRSCPPLSCGCPGRPRSKSIPRATHQTDSRLKPKSAWVCAKGAPLSLRMAWGEAILLKQTLETQPHALRPGVGQPAQLQQISTIFVSHRQRFTPLPRWIVPPTFKVHRPHFIRGLAPALSPQPSRLGCRPSLAPFRQTRPRQHPLETAFRGRCPLHPQIQRPDLTRAPIGMQLLEPHHLTNHLRTQLLRMPLRPARLLRQPLHAPTQQTLPPLVPRLGTYPILGTQHAKVVRAQRFHRKLNPLFHRSIRFPRHSRAYCLQPASLSVTYVLNHPCYSCSEPAPCLKWFAKPCGG